MSLECTCWEWLFCKRWYVGEELKKEFLIAQCRVYDAIVASGGVLNVNIINGMLTYARQSHYQECLKQKWEKAANEEKKAKEKKACWTNQRIGR